MSEPRQYPMPWDFVRSLMPHVPRRTRASLDQATRLLAAHLEPEPVIECAGVIPADPRFVVVANHFQRKGLWIAYSAAVITRALIARFGPGEPPIRWVVTANWPPWRVGRWTIASPGDVLLPRVAHALWCYDVPFAGSDPARTAASIRGLLRDARTADHPFGLFPEGVAGTAERMAPPLPGTDRLIAMLARQGYPVLPARFRETDRLILRFGPPISPAELLSAGDPASLALARVSELSP